MMKLKNKLLLMIGFLSFSSLNGQNLKCDTTYLIRNSFLYLAKDISLDKFRKCNCTYSEKRWKGNDSDSYYLSNNIGSSYFIFKDKKNRIIEQGYWLGEFFNGLYISYYKNGKVKSKGKFAGEEKTGEWLYYDEKGNLQKKETYN